ncbi:inactive protein RESTRICTED TEV MOVEMENT 2-like [Prosopis cineraria]|uniref:inactive protein RESTRICTED TEV MOVEMENT 2-like n=1 Tax=Prosopis cineraria TaxID=364024 RepID=UPI0024102298|nr:inactive protein RESTRICTED TEV MOVEMENT 2-like [Prosopis cineraria]
MASTVRGGRRAGVRTSSRAPIVEQIVPNSGWTEDSTGHYLLVDLPGFKKEEVKLQVEGSGYIIVRGERQVNEEKRVHFELIFPVPKDSDTDKIAGKFDGEILYVTITKRPAQENTETEAAMAANGSVRSPEENYKREDHGADHNQQRGHNTQHDLHREEEIRRKEVTHVGSFSEELIRKWEKEPTILTSAVKVLRQNKGIVITAVLAFSLGLLVSRKFQSSTAP